MIRNFIYDINLLDILYLGTAIAPLVQTPWKTLGTICGSTYLRNLSGRAHWYQPSSLVQIIDLFRHCIFPQLTFRRRNFLLNIRTSCI